MSFNLVLDCLDGDQILPAGKQNGHLSDSQDLQPLRWDVHVVQVKYYDNT